MGLATTCFWLTESLSLSTWFSVLLSAGQISILMVICGVFLFPHRYFVIFSCLLKSYLFVNIYQISSEFWDRFHSLDFCYRFYTIEFTTLSYAQALFLFLTIVHKIWIQTLLSFSLVITITQGTLLMPRKSSELWYNIWWDNIYA